MNTTKNTGIMEWYLSEYPHETNGSLMNPEITFGEFSEKVWANHDVYELMGVESNTMRTRLFKEVASLRNIPHGHVENEWVWADY